jgi:fatty-acyl-CoA synthase
MVAALTAEYAATKIGSVGHTTLLTQVRLIDAEGGEVTEPLARGEICVCGPNVMRGYWNQPEATRQALSADGWFRTGDVGYRDADGFYYVCDRVKDMIITGGENVYPAEIESVLAGHPAIAEVAVIGAPDERWGETVVAVAALKPGHTLGLEELQAFAGERLARYKLPRQLQLVAALPRNPTGKILKYKLRDEQRQAPGGGANGV